MSRLADKALEWATASWSQIHRLSYAQFIKEFKIVFDHPYEGKISGELLSKLHQGNRSVVEYSLEFRTLAASSGWNEAALLVTFRQGLNAEILSEIASKDDDLTLDQLITLAIKLDHLLHHRKLKGERTSRRPISRLRLTPETVESTEPMQCDSSRLSQEERMRRLTNHLCLYCGKAGHQVREIGRADRKSVV